MFTSRAEHRILLRQDNADLRLTETGYKIGLATHEQYEKLLQKKNRIELLTQYLENTAVEPEEINCHLEEIGSSTLPQKTKLAQLLLRPEIDLGFLMERIATLQQFIQEEGIGKEAWKQSEISIKYKNYIEKEQETAAKISYLENIRLKPETDYNSIQSLSTEARQKLSRIKPETLGQASRISGVSPSDISVLLVLLGR